MRHSAEFWFGLVAQKDDVNRGVKRGYVFTPQYVEDLVRQFLIQHKGKFSADDKVSFAVTPGSGFNGTGFEPFVMVELISTSGLSEDWYRQLFEFVSCCLGRVNPRWLED